MPVVLLVPLLVTTVAVRLVTGQLGRRSASASERWSSWPAAAAAGMAAVYVCTAITHFIEPQRSGLEAIVPPMVPMPGLVVTLSGVAEFAIAAGLVFPRTRRWAALASIVLLIVLFPANVIAADGVDHPAAPSTPLLPRAALQLAFLGFSVAALLPGTRGRLPRHP